MDLNRCDGAYLDHHDQHGHNKYIQHGPTSVVVHQVEVSLDRCGVRLSVIHDPEQYPDLQKRQDHTEHCHQDKEQDLTMREELIDPGEDRERVLYDDEL